MAVRSVQAMKDGQFKLTAIKIELEAHLDRSNSNDYCGECNEGHIDCESCEGMCDIGCEECGRGGCEECNQRGRIRCEDCDGRGSVDCPDCGITGNNWGSVRVCQNYILSKLAPLGLAEVQPDGSYKPVKPLVFARFYNDGSVDSELTATLLMNKAENVLLLPKLIEAFSDLANEMGSAIDTRRAGMHTALLNSKDGYYETNRSRGKVSGPREGDKTRFKNFKRSMSLLLPALFFLGTSNDKTRAMEFRIPRVSDIEKYSAIAYRGGAVEFRVFDTCYNNPDAILDNIVTMKNCMKYWRDTYRKVGVSNIARDVVFGLDGSDKLDRLFVTTTHIDLLNRGLQLLKPSYYSISDVKRQRNFTQNKVKINKTLRERQKQALVEYMEYEERYGWNLVIRQNQYRADFIERHTYDHSPSQLRAMDREAVLQEIETQVQSELEKYKERMETKDNYIKKRIDELQNRKAGNWHLTESEA